MADTLGTGTLTLTTTVTLPIGAMDYGFTKSHTIAAVEAPMDRRIEVPTASEIQIFGFNNAAGIDGLGAIKSTDLLVIINDDDTNFVRLRVNANGADTADFKLLPGMTFILGSQDMSVNTTEAAFAAFTTIDEVHAQADTAAVILRTLAYRT